MEKKQSVFEEEDEIEESRRCNNIGDVPRPSQKHIDVLKKNFGHSEFKDAQWKVCILNIH